MARNYEEFPFPEFKHAIKNGKNTYRNKFFHDIDLSFILKWMDSIEGENYTIRIVGDKLQLIDGEGQVVSEVTLSEGQQGPPGITPNVNASAYVDNNTGTPSVTVTKAGTTENPTFEFNFSNLKGAKGDASTVPGPRGADGTPFQVKAQYDTYAEMIAAHPTGQVGDAYQVGHNSGLATVATTGDYDDLINKPTIPAAQVNSDWNANSGVAQILNKPTIPAAQVNSDWNANSGVAQILNKPTIPAAQVNSDWNASSGVAEILNKPTIPTINDSTITLTQGGVTKGSFTLNQSSAATINLDAGGGGAVIPIIPDVYGTIWEIYNDTYYHNPTKLYDRSNDMYFDFTNGTTYYLRLGGTGSKMPIELPGGKSIFFDSAVGGWIMSAMIPGISTFDFSDYADELSVLGTQDRVQLIPYRLKLDNDYFSEGKVTFNSASLIQVRESGDQSEVVLNKCKYMVEVVVTCTASFRWEPWSAWSSDLALIAQSGVSDSVNSKYLTM